MASIAVPSRQNAGHLRPLNILRDLPAVADLIELCFSSTMDSDGRSYLEQMRQSAHDNRFLNWAPRMIDSVSLPLSGFVWEEEGRIVGNVSLIPFFKWGRRVYLVANVATHPDQRRRGIARQLTQAAMQRAREKRADTIWLHVRDDNPGAIALYREMGFVERARRTQWIARPGGDPPAMVHPLLVIRPRAGQDWQLQRNWLDYCYPPDLNWYFQQSWDFLKPGLLGGFFRLISEENIQQWSIFRDGALKGVMAVQESYRSTAQAWLAFPAHSDTDALTAMLIHARRQFAGRRTISLDVPTSQSEAAFHAAGFTAQRTLMWMEAPGSGEIASRDATLS
jgi:GNAT superfamily N-acetyltransferase